MVLDHLDIIVLLTGGLIFLLVLITVLISIFEHEKLAAQRLLLIAFILVIPYIAAALPDYPWKNNVEWVLLGITVLIPLFFFIPVGSAIEQGNNIPSAGYDERDIMFSRALLKQGTERFDEYYKNNPGNRDADDRFRSEPGLLSENASMYHPYFFPAAESCFNTIVNLRDHTDGSVAGEKAETDPARVTEFIKNMILQYDAHSVGITTIKDYHKYIYYGREKNYGRPVENDHKYAIAFTVEMDRYMNMCAPYAPTAFESAKQYLNSARISLAVSAFIREMGYPARAHIDGKYDIICPLVARDAGLGEIGRMGILMTPKLGPRVRIGVVTTDLPLMPDEYKPDLTVKEFCTYCSKCADVCPSRAIPFDDMKDHNGVDKWQLNSEECYRFWCISGTDCGKCMAVCPYSHPDNIFHNVIRAGIRHSRFFRKIAVKLDDIIYSRKPKPFKMKKWMLKTKEKQQFSNSTI